MLSAKQSFSAFLALTQAWLEERLPGMRGTRPPVPAPSPPAPSATPGSPVCRPQGAPWRSAAHQLSANTSVCPDDGGRSGLVGGGRVCAAHGESPPLAQRATCKLD